jgi:hypothetical protein
MINQNCETRVVRPSAGCRKACRRTPGGGRCASGCPTPGSHRCRPSRRCVTLRGHVKSVWAAEGAALASLQCGVINTPPCRREAGCSVLQTVPGWRRGREGGVGPAATRTPRSLQRRSALPEGYHRTVRRLSSDEVRRMLRIHVGGPHHAAARGVWALRARQLRPLPQHRAERGHPLGGFIAVTVPHW